VFIAATKALIRPLQPSDADALSEIFRAAWTEAYSGILPADFIRRQTERRAPQWWRDVSARRPAATSTQSPIVLEVDGIVAGYTLVGPSRAPPRRNLGEIYELYLAPEFQGQGYGEFLFEGARATLDSANATGLVVWVLEANIRAQQFYWARGGRPFARRRENLFGRAVGLVGYDFG